MLNEVLRLTSRDFEEIKRKFKKPKKQNTLEKYTFTSCDNCIHKIEKIHQSECLECSHYYGSSFERKTDASN